MFQRFNAMKERREEGFTLIELLVVILIIAILAAIAIPVFLNQRNKGYVSQAESALRNAATNMESYATGNNGTYPAVGEEALLISEGYRPTTSVTVTIASSAATGYCLNADHANLGATGTSVDYKYNSTIGRPVAGACP